MNSNLTEIFISQKRMESYINMMEYEQNLVFSKKAYIPLSVLEVALRNSIDTFLSEKISDEWYREENFLTKDSQKKVDDAIKLLVRRKEHTPKDKIIAELSFGFWVNLFKAPYAKNLRINDLKKIFPNLPSKHIKLINREYLFKRLNHIRKFRNRVFHYEKVLNKDTYNHIFEEIEELLVYFDKDLYNFIQKINNE